MFFLEYIHGEPPLRVEEPIHLSIDDEEAGQEAICLDLDSVDLDDTNPPCTMTDAEIQWGDVGEEQPAESETGIDWSAVGDDDNLIVLEDSGNAGGIYPEFMLFDVLAKTFFHR